MQLNWTSHEIAQLNEFANFLSFKETEQFRLLMNSPHRYIVMLAGNQGGKSSGVARHYVMRFLGLHPIAQKNSSYFVCKNDHKQALVSAPENGRCKECEEALELYCEPSYLRVYRFASHNLPGTAGEERQEVRNTQHPELRKWLPSYLVKKDINSRSPVMAIKCVNGGSDLLVEFVSYGQDVQATAGPQRRSLWADEMPPFDFMEEQYPRLLAANGDIVFSLTAADRNAWLFDEYYEKAAIITRTDHVKNAPVVKKLFGELSKHEERKTGKDIRVIQFATDDNPTLNPQAINELFANIDDDTTLARRRYGMFAQMSGRVLKSYSHATHFQPMAKWFPNGIPWQWTHARGIDYHQRVDWHFAVASLSPHNEMFVWAEMKLSPDSMTTYEMAERIALCTPKEYNFLLSKIDPLANVMQVNTGFTTIQDLNKYFVDMKTADVGSGGYWQPWDTKSLRGREQLRLRLKNSLRCRVPFNNAVNDHKGTHYLPTIWIMDTCPGVAQYCRMWRHEENKGRDDGATKDEREDVQQKWSHYPMVLEGILKEVSFQPRIGERMLQDRDSELHQYFNTLRGR